MNPEDNGSAADSTTNLLHNDQREGRIYRIVYPIRKHLAEYFGTVLFISFGLGAFAQSILNKPPIGSNYLSINVAFGLGLTAAILVVGSTSGAHFNPGITLASAIYRDFPWKLVPGYMFVQLLGAFTSAALIYLVYWPAIYTFDSGTRHSKGDYATAGIFTTSPYKDAPNFNSLLVEIIITAIFLVCIFGITDPRNKIPPFMGAIGTGISITVIGLSLGIMTNFSLNPARDLGPRIFISLAGWGIEPFYVDNYYFWIPIIGPFLGAILGGAIYTFMILPDNS